MTVSTIVCKLMILLVFMIYFAKKLSLVVEHCMSKCPVKVLDCYGQADIQDFRSCLFVWTITAELQNLL